MQNACKLVPCKERRKGLRVVEMRMHLYTCAHFSGTWHLFVPSEQTNSWRKLLQVMYDFVRCWRWWRWKMIKVSHLNVFLMYACLHATIILLSWLFKRKFTTTHFLVFVVCVCVCVCHSYYIQSCIKLLVKTKQQECIRNALYHANIPLAHRDKHRRLSKQKFYTALHILHDNIPNSNAKTKTDSSLLKCSFMPSVSGLLNYYENTSHMQMHTNFIIVYTRRKWWWIVYSLIQQQYKVHFEIFFICSLWFIQHLLLSFTKSLMKLYAQYKLFLGKVSKTQQ